MWDKCGIIRTGEALEQACEELETQHATVELLIARCALARRESRGAHYRLDYPDKRPEFEKHSMIQKDTGVTFR